MNAMICPYCGKENADGLDVCNFCGASLIAPEIQPTVSSKPQESSQEVVQPQAESTEPQAETSPIPDVSQEARPPEDQSPAPPRGRLYGNKVWWLVGGLVFICLVLGSVAVVLGLNRINDGFDIPNDDTTVIPPTSTLFSTEIATLLPATDITLAPPSGSPTQKTPVMLFFDDFSNINSGWDMVDEADYSTNYYDNAYRIVVNTEMSDSWANPSEHTFNDVSVEVEATKNSGPDDNDFGLICRYRDSDHFYYAVISSDGYFGISKVATEASAILGYDSLQYSNVINQGSATNHIRFDCIDDVFTLYVNGQQLNQQTDSDYASGNVGLIAGTYETPGTDILFDNFSVSAP
jgi:hypothetical protein